MSLSVQLPCGDLLVGIDVDAVPAGEGQMQTSVVTRPGLGYAAPARLSSGRSCTEIRKVDEYRLGGKRPAAGRVSSKGREITTSL